MANILNRNKEKPHSGVGSSFIEVFAVDGVYHKILKEQSTLLSTPIEENEQEENEQEEKNELTPLLTKEEIHSEIEINRERKKLERQLIKEKRKRLTYLIGSSLVFTAFVLGVTIESKVNTRKKNTVKKDIANTFETSSKKNKNNTTENNAIEKPLSRALRENPEEPIKNTNIDIKEDNRIENSNEIVLPPINYNHTDPEGPSENVDIEEEIIDMEEDIKAMEEQLLNEMEGNEELQKLINNH